MMTDDEIIAVIQAHKEGKRIQCKLINEPYAGWSGPHKDVIWNFGKYEFRAFPEPYKPREWTINITKEPIIGDKIIGGCEYGRACGIPGNNVKQVHVREVIEE